MEDDFDPWDDNKKKKKDFTNPFDFFTNFTDFESFFEQLNRFMEEMFKSFPAFKPFNTNDTQVNPFVWGFRIKYGPDGPKIERFGDIPKPTSKGIESPAREPLVDIIEDEKELIIIAELPGVAQKDIKLLSTESELKIDAGKPPRHYYKHLYLPRKVNPKSAKAKLKNGVLTIKYQYQ